MHLLSLGGMGNAVLRCPWSFLTPSPDIPCDLIYSAVTIPPHVCTFVPGGRVRNPRIVPWVLCLLFVFACALPAQAALLYDGFDYVAGAALSGQTNNNVQPPLTWAFVGTAGGANGTLDPKIGAGSLTYPGLPASVGNSVLTDRNQTGVSRIALPSAQTTGTVYYSMIVKVTDITALTNTTTGSFLAGLNNTTAAGG